MDELAEKYKAKMAKAIEVYGDDCEQLHLACDAILCEMLREAGYGAVVDMRDKVSKNFWYA